MLAVEHLDEGEIRRVAADAGNQLHQRLAHLGCIEEQCMRQAFIAELLSLGAIDFGLIVDSSVIMVENCVRHAALRPDAPRLELVRDAAVEVRKPTMFGELIILTERDATDIWHAFDDASEYGPIGFGKTEQAAIDDLISQL